MKYIPNFDNAYQLMHDGILALARAEQNGMRVDTDYIDEQIGYLNLKIIRLEEELTQTKFYKRWVNTTRGKVNINSNYQLSRYLYEVKKFEIIKTTSSDVGSTDDETLNQLSAMYDVPELKMLLQLRKLNRVKDTYLMAFAREQVNGWLHPFFNLHLVVTYRSSSNFPNLQNIPKRDKQSMQICRRALFPRKGHQLLEVDYSELEVRIATCYHKDPKMIAYNNNPASDMHGDMAKQIFMLDKFNKANPYHSTLRQAAKNGFVFPQFYGDYYKNCSTNIAMNWCKLPKGSWKKNQGIHFESEGSISDHLRNKGIQSLSDFEEHIKVIEKDFWGKRFPKYAEWKEEWWANYKKRGYIEMYTGFVCRDIMGKNDCINYPIQGAAFHCLLWSFIQIDKFLIRNKLNTRLIGQIHDSILIDTDPNELDYIVETVHRITCLDLPKVWKWIIVPLHVDMELAPVDASWAEKEKYKFK